MDPVTGTILLIGLGINLIGSWFKGVGAKKTNEHQQEILQNQMDDLTETYALDEERYETAVEQTKEMADKAAEDLTAKAGEIMTGLREDRDQILSGTIAKTDILGGQISEQDRQLQIKQGGEFATAGYSGVAMSGSSQQVLQQNSAANDSSIDLASAQLALNRDQGYYGAYSKERGAVNTNTAMNRELENIDLQLQNNLENLQQSKDLLDLNYENQMDALQYNKDWLADNKWQTMAGMGFDMAGDFISFGTQAYEWEIFE